MQQPPRRSDKSASRDAASVRPPGRAALRRWARAARADSGRVVILGLVGAACTILFAWSLAAGVAQALAGGSDASWLAIGAVAIAVKSALSWLSDRIAAAAGRKMVAAARGDIAGAIDQRGVSLLLGDTPGARTSQIVDRTARLSGWARSWIAGSQLAVLIPLVILIAVAAQSWVCAILLALSVILLPVFLWLTIAETRATAGAQQASLDALSGAFQLRTEHAGVIRAFRAIGRETQALRAAALDLKRSTMRVLRIAFLSTAVLEFFSAVSIALLAVYIGFKLLGLFPFATGETVTLREGMMVLILAPEFFAPIRKLSALHHDRADAVSAADMLGPWLAVESPPRSLLPRLPQAPAITFGNVSIRRGVDVAVSGVSFGAAPGEITALAGPSGSGKTSCLLALVGLAQFEEGEVLVNDRRLASGESLAQSAAYVGQTPWLAEGSLADNLRIGDAAATDAELLAALGQAGAAHLAESHADGLARRIGRGGQGLSGGERQRIALARAILRDAPIWLLDEPTAHLDIETESQILALLRSLAAGRTLIMATHSVAALRAADAVVHLAPSARVAA